MLKIYNIHYYVSIDNEPWERIDSIGVIMHEESQATPEHIRWDNISFEECCNLLRNTHVAGIWLSETLFTHKPLVNISYSRGYDNASYKHFNSISYKVTFTEDEYCSLLYIMNKFPADQTIQYLKERGIATLACPILKE